MDNIVAGGVELSPQMPKPISDLSAFIAYYRDLL